MMLTFRFCLLGLSYSTDPLGVTVRMDGHVVYEGLVKTTHTKPLEDTFTDDSQILAEFDWSTDNLSFPRSMSVSVQVWGRTPEFGLVVEDLGVACPYIGPEELRPVKNTLFAPCVVLDPNVQSKTQVKINDIDFGFYLDNTPDLNGPWKYPVNSTKTISWVYENFCIDDDLISVATSLQ